MFASRLRLITFDVTDTLLKFRVAPGLQYAEIAALYGISCDGDKMGANFKTHFRKMNTEYPNYGLKSGFGWENWWKTIVKNTFNDTECVGGKLSDDKLEEIAKHLINVYKTSACWQHCKGASDLLSYIKSRGIPMGIISNTDPRLQQVLVNMKLQHYFRFILTSYEAGVAKPDEKIFGKAMEISQINELKPEECLHVGDDLMLDYFGARNSGWNGALIADEKAKIIFEKTPNVNVSHLFNSLYDLHKHFVDVSGEKLSSQKL